MLKRLLLFLLSIVRSWEGRNGRTVEKADAGTEQATEEQRFVELGYSFTGSGYLLGFPVQIVSDEGSMQEVVEPRIQNHILIDTPFFPTSNKGGEIKPRYLLSHYTASGNMEGTVSYFQSKASKVSAHIVIGRDGRMVQMVAFNRRAWHAGDSQWDGFVGLNDFSIGIEYVNWGPLRYEDGRLYGRTGKQIAREDAVYLLGPDNEGRWWQKFTIEQLEVGLNVSRELFRHYGLVDSLGHFQVSPGRKIDPGPAFPLADLRSFCMSDHAEFRDDTGEVIALSDPGQATTTTLI